ncbi:MFS transporter [Aspergillus homomorphus CBS 101889]|uniref:MFS general substrate transporter n=1 Tax=Aspergillus homomorphus (strain CBS 101889) TaxID=1450537 RepID=A0A395I6B8_ASPHC|nr:MFS general substrate transporter [Aspergillus homomorphus CBS 101889]RAL15771.1 MFS general substrate transporter [Aspergillus homomorphus CBS 101889]
MAWDLCGLRPNQGQQKPPRFLKWRTSDAFVSFVVCFAVFTDVLMYGLIVPVAPTALRDRVGMSDADVQSWQSTLLALYGVTQLTVSPISGYLADKFQSRWWPFVGGLVLLAAATGLLCFGTNLALWIVGRLFQGASAAVVWTVGTALLVDTVGKEGLGQSLGYLGMAMTIGTVTGPLLGGVLYGNGGYYAVFGLAFGIIALDVILRLVMIERKHALKWLQADGVQIVPPENQGSDTGLENGASPATSDGSRDAQKGCHETERESSTSTDDETSKKRPSTMYTLLASGRMMTSMWAYFIISLVLTSFDSVLPLFVEQTFGWGQSGQGLIFIAISVPQIFDPGVGYIIDHWGQSRRYMAAGGFFAAIPSLACLRFVTDDTMEDKVLMCALLLLVGTCVCLIMSPVMVEATYYVQDKEAETPGIFGEGGAIAFAYGVINMAYAVGTIIGPFFAGFIKSDAGWSTMTWALALMAGVSGIPTFLFLRESAKNEASSTVEKTSSRE